MTNPHQPGDVNCCVVCGLYPCVWGLCMPCRDKHCTKVVSGKVVTWIRPRWIKDLLAMHRKAQRRRKDPRHREISLEEVWTPETGYDALCQSWGEA